MSILSTVMHHSFDDPLIKYFTVQEAPKYFGIQSSQIRVEDQSMCILNVSLHVLHYYNIRVNEFENFHYLL